jgi:hypothetical protein
MANTPQLLTKDQLVGLIIDSVLARIDDVDDLNVGSTITQLAEGVGQVIYKPYADVVSMITALSTDRAVGEALQRKARDNDVPIFPALPASGLVSISDLTFSKVQSTVYAGQPAPVAGSLVIYVSNASQFLPTGIIYIGRGTPNVEGPLTYTSVTSLAGGTYFALNLSASTPTAKFHNIGETVIMGQGGNRPVPAGTVCKTQQGSAVSAASYTTTVAATILDGETTVDQVPVVCQQVGTVGNVPRGAVQQVSGLSFNASCFNPQPFSNGRAADSEDQIRDRIKEYEQLKSRGTGPALKAAAIDVVAPDELKRSTSANAVTYADGSAAVVFDDGTGYEPAFVGIGVESVVDEALGGDRDLQLRNAPTAQARLESGAEFPYAIADLDQLSVTISGKTTVHRFRSTDFRVPGAATAFEAAASINANPNLNFLANTSRGGKRLVVFPRDPRVNSIVVNALSSQDANAAIQFVVGATQYTARLYRNDSLLFQDGLLARVSTRAKPSWSNGIIDGDTLTYQIDGTPEVTATFTLADFQAVNPSSTVNAAEPIAVWAAVFNRLMPGVSATVEGDVVHLDSNRGFSGGARIQITGGTIRDKIFEIGASLDSTGRSSDYTFNRNTSQLSLAVPLDVGDRLSVGSPFTRAKLFTAALPSGPSTAGTVWFVVDGDASIVPNTMRSSTQIRFTRPSVANIALTRATNAVTVDTATPHGLSPGDVVVVDGVSPTSFNGTFTVASTPSSTQFTYLQAGINESATVFGTTSSSDTTLHGRNSATLDPEAFDKALPGDWLLVWSDPGDQAGLAANVGFWRVTKAETGSLTFKNDSGTNTGWMGSIPISRIALVRSLAPIQKLSYASGSLVSLANQIASQLVGVDADIVGSKIRISTKTSGSNGQLLAVAADTAGQSLGITIGTAADNTDSHFGFNATDEIAYGFPSFTHSEVGEVSQPDEIVDGVDDYPDLGGTSQDYLEFLNRFDLGDLTVVSESNRRRRAFVRNYDPSIDTMSVVLPSYLGSGSSIIQKDDRFFVRSAYQLDSDDKLTVVLDGDPSVKTFNLPVARRLQVSGASSPTLTSFSATDKESSLSLNDQSSFQGFSFLDFKVWRQAAAVLTDGTYNLKAKFADYGPAGNRARVGILYPDDASATSLSHRISTSDVVDVGIVIPFQTPRSPSWDGTSAFTVALSTVGGLDTVTFTWRVGAQPDFTISGSALSVGDVVVVSPSSDFRAGNRGFSAKVAAFTATSFTVKRPTGYAVADAPVLSSISNVGGTVTCTVVAGHSIENGDRIGIYDTAQSTVGVFPLSSTYFATVVNPTTFTVPTPPGTPGGAIAAASHAANLVTVTAPSHGLSVGNVVTVSGVSVGSYNGTFSVYAVPSVNTFQYVVAGSSASVANDGRFDFQSYLASGPGATISTISRTGGTVTVNTSAPHGFSSSQLVQVSGVDVDDWSALTTYGLGDVIQNSFDGLLYKSLQASNLGNAPHLSPAYWQLTAFDLTGTFVITVTGLSQFTYDYADTTGSQSGTGGSATVFAQSGRLARCVGASTGYLAFGQVGATAQQIVDYATNNLSGRLLVSNNGGSLSAIVDTSTEDLGIPGNYLSGSVSAIRAIKGSRYVDITVSASVDPGATITVDVANPLYDGRYVVLESTPSGSSWILRCASAVLSLTTGNVSGGSGTFVGSYPYLMFRDGENSVLAQNLGTPPNFTLKRAWFAAPPVGEEIRLVAANKDHLVRFWNKLIVSGISNLAKVQPAMFGEDLQVATATFGSSGSVQVASSLANNGTVALSSAGAELSGKLGLFSVPYDLRKGLTAGGWVKLTQTVAQAKVLGFGASTQVKVHSDGVELPDTLNGTFQTKRTTAQAYDSAFMVERHGKFTAFVHAGGTSPSVGTAGVKEGDWVRIQNVLPQLYDGALTYARGRKVRLSNGQRYVATAAVPISTSPPNASYWAPYADYSASATYSSNASLGDRFALFDGRVWEAVDAAPFSGVQPGTDQSRWQQREWAGSSQGIYQVVRTFGEGSFWVEGSLVEEVTVLLDPADLSFYSYDSVMPGDTLSISGSVLGQANIGQYVVQDDVADGSSLFPTATRLHTAPIPQDTGASFVILGTNFGQVSVIEESPTVLYKRISSVGPGLEGLASVVVDSPESIAKISNSLGAYLTMENKIGFSTDVRQGIDGYKHYVGLLKEVNRVIYGDPTSPVDFPGYKAAGADVDVKPALVKRIQLSLSIRIKIGLSYTEIQDRVRAAVAGYVNQLGPGQPVSLSEVVSAANKVNGVVAVAVVSPAYGVGSDLIQVGADQVAKIVNPQEDVLVSIVGT